MHSSDLERISVSVGALLQKRRKLRHLSQLALATEAGISPRHLSFLETGRARPSRQMVLLLANALDVPLRERNAWLLAAGFAPTFVESSLDAPALAVVRSALDAILRQQEPFPAVVMNRRWDIVIGNAAATRFFAYLLDGHAPAREPANVVHLIFDPAALRPRVQNWQAVAVALFQRIRREAVGGLGDETTAQLLEEVLAYPEVRPLLSDVDTEQPSVPIIPVTFSKAKGEPVFNFFSTVTTLGTPQDITLQELRIECFFPADARTEAHARGLAAGRETRPE